MLEDINWTTAFGVLLVYGLMEALYVYWVYVVAELRAARAANVSTLMHLLGAFGVISYTQNQWYIIPLVIGAWIGTYLVVKFKAKS